MSHNYLLLLCGYVYNMHVGSVYRHALHASALACAHVWRPEGIQWPLSLEAGSLPESRAQILWQALIHFKKVSTHIKTTLLLNSCLDQHRGF